MKKIFFFLIIALVISACDKKPTETAMTQKNVPYTTNEEGSKIFAIKAYGDSNQTGMLLVDPGESNKTLITIDVGGDGTLEKQPIAIHQGNCEGKIGNVLYPLSTLGDGMSETLLEMDPDEFVAKDNLAVVVKKSLTQPEVITACGDL